MERTSWSEHVTNEEIFRVYKREVLISIIRERQANWIGQVLRHDSLLGDIIEGRPSSKRPIGRPRHKTLDWMIDTKNGKTYDHLKEKAPWREKWS